MQKLEPKVKTFPIIYVVERLIRHACVAHGNLAVALFFRFFLRRGSEKKSKRFYEIDLAFY